MNRQAYPQYKPSGVAWLGDIPEHWEMSRVKHIARFTTGWTPQTSQDEYYFGGNPWATIADLGPRLLGDPKGRISDDAIASSRMRISPKGSLLFSFKLSIGQVSIADRDLYTNEAIATFPPDNGTDVGYLYWAAPLFIPMNADENIYGAKLLGQETIKNATFAVPPANEQQAIAAFLDRETARIDSLIEKKQRQIELLQEKRSALISHAVTKGLDPKVSMKDSGIEWLGEVPEHWEVMSIKFALDIPITDGPHETPEFLPDGIPFLSAESVKDDRLDFSKKRGFISEGDHARFSKKYIPQRGDVYMVKSGATTGNVARVETDEVFNIWSPLAVFRPAPARASTDFIFYFMKSRSFLASVELAWSYGTQQNIGMGVVSNLKLALPPVLEQSKITTTLNEETHRIEALSAKVLESIEKLREYRKALISSAVTGKIDVRRADART